MESNINFNNESKEINDSKNNSNLSLFEKIIQLNKLGSLFLAGGNNSKAISILYKTVELYENSIKNKEIPSFFYGNLYCNLAKAYSVDKMFDKAEELYIKIIQNHPLKKVLENNKEYIETNYLINIYNTLEIREFDIKDNGLNEINQRHKILIEFYNTSNKPEYNYFPSKLFKKNNLNNVSSFSDSLINYAVILQNKLKKETLTTYEMYYLSLLCDPDNNVGNIDYNNFLRENNYKNLSDEFIIKRINFDNLKSLQCTITNNVKIDLLQIKSNIWKENNNKISFVCMKWGNKYDYNYVNKLFNGIKRNINKDIKYDFICITENKDNLNNEIKIIDLNCNFKGWMKKGYLFSEDISKHLAKRVCFIDLDMIIYNDISFIANYEGDFCLLNTNDIKCENSKEGYNSSIILWRNNLCNNIYNFLLNFHNYITKQVIRFDHYLEFIVKNSDFIQNKFPGKVLDYNSYCKEKDILPIDGSIIAFPRYPKPHECCEKWISEHWI